MTRAFVCEQMALPLDGGAMGASPAATVAVAPSRRRPATGGGVQMDLSVSTAQGVRRRSAGDHHATGLYDAVLTLREAGRRVYRCGGLHQVDGRQLTTRELLLWAAAIGGRR
ncbi:hypothetical protein [Azospirillum sp. sgz302134]